MLMLDNDYQLLEDIKDGFEDRVKSIAEPRLDRNKLHSIHEILFLVLCAGIANCTGWRSIERYGNTISKLFA
jgi:hypothetical protein